ncbi:MAG: hypothetical protein LLG02_00235 [Pelosinus sp.]|nr:hypothetical protein [Pelosinus sp.]
MIKHVIDGKKLDEADILHAWQKFVLSRMQEVMADDDNIKAHYITYNRGFWDGLKMAMSLENLKP